MNEMQFKQPLTCSKWVTYLKRPLNPKLTLICFPFAGGDASFYQDWAAEIKADIQIIAIQFPGRANRFLEEPYINLDVLISDLINELGECIETPYVLFGHSLGGITIFELTRKLAENNQPLPLHLFISGCGAPHLLKNKGRYHLPNQTFIEMIKEMDGTPKEILENQEIMELLVPMLRADFQLIETYRYEERKKQPHLPITVIGGSDDKEVGMAELTAWQDITQGSCKVHILQGGHFFLKESKVAFFELMNQAIKQLM